MLAALPDEQLIAYIQKARTAARTEAMTLALSVLVFGYLDIVTRRVVLKVPPADVDDVAHEAILSAIRSAFSGESIGEFRGWLNRITSRRIADYHRRLEGKPKTVPLLSGDEEDDAGWGEVPAAEFEGVSVDAERAIETAYGSLSDAPPANRGRLRVRRQTCARGGRRGGHERRQRAPGGLAFPPPREGPARGRR